MGFELLQFELHTDVLLIIFVIRMVFVHFEFNFVIGPDSVD